MLWDEAWTLNLGWKSLLCVQQTGCGQQLRLLQAQAWSPKQLLRCWNCGVAWWAHRWMVNQHDTLNVITHAVKHHALWYKFQETWFDCPAVQWCFWPGHPQKWHQSLYCFQVPVNVWCACEPWWPCTLLKSLRVTPSMGWMSWSLRPPLVKDCCGASILWWRNHPVKRSPSMNHHQWPIPPWRGNHAWFWEHLLLSQWTALKRWCWFFDQWYFLRLTWSGLKNM